MEVTGVDSHAFKGYLACVPWTTPIIAGARQLSSSTRFESVQRAALLLRRLKEVAAGERSEPVASEARADRSKRSLCGTLCWNEASDLSEEADDKHFRGVDLIVGRGRRHWAKRRQWLLRPVTSQSRDKGRRQL